MPARRCSNCSINYPQGVEYRECLVCEGSTSWFNNVGPDEDWEEQVMRLTAPDRTFEDKRDKWRYEQLRRAGLSEGGALELASRYDVDLHQAVHIAKKAGPELAYRILV